MSSVLETFYLIFSSNADEVDEGSKQAKKSADELEDSLKDTDLQTKSVGKSFLSLATAAAAALASLGAGAAVVTAALDAAAFAEDLRLSSMAIDENIEDIQAWGEATRQFGGDVTSLQNTLTGLNNNIRETAFTGEGSLSPVLRRLGVNIRDLSGNIKTPLELLPDLADAFARLSSAEALHLGTQLGLDQPTILLLQKGHGEVERLVNSERAFGIVTKENAEASRKFTEQMRDTADIFTHIKQRLAFDTLPAMTWFYEKLELVGEFINENGTLVQGFFIAVAGAVTAFYLPAMLRAAAATLAATWPILAIIAIVAALAAEFALLYDEVVNFINGQDSLIGEAIKKWPMLGKVIELIAAGFSASSLGNAIKFVIELAAKFFSFFLAPPGDRLKILADQLAKIRSLLGFDTDLDMSVTSDIAKGQAAIAGASASPLAAQTSNSIIANKVGGNRSIEMPITNLVVQTQATDASGISSAITGTLQEQIRSAMFQFDDGVES